MRRFGVALLSACALCATTTTTTTTTNNPPANCKSPDKLFQELKKLLSPATAIHLPGSDEFEAATTRWSELDTPTANIVVVPATEDDVARTVYQANKCGVPVLAFNGVHGAITTLGRMTSGVAIQLGQLSNVTVARDGKTATIGGGTLSKTVTDTLWTSGKQTVTGTCECVSYLGPALGGGHGWLQGHHGLVADQFISMNVVLADGIRHTINSSSDLWWAVKGAGQNFGIVTSVTVKVYDIEDRDWAIETLIFSGDQVEAVYEAANQHLSNLPADVINWSYWLNMVDIDQDKPVILFYIIQEGVTVVDPVYTSPFHDIGPISSEPMSGSYRDLAAWTGIAVDSPPCQKAGLANPRFPIYLREHNVTAQREAYDVFAANVGGADSLFTNSIFMFEAYPQQGVRAVDSSSTAFAFRDDNLLVSPLLTYTPAGTELDAQVESIGNQLRDIIYRGSGRTELHAYINYAYGDETPKNWFGYEQWRQTRLQKLKQKYDPKGKFSFYGPIV
ncbi:putative FAD-dependent oxygenase [Xylaria telfairii]|nr:putative FAD-dependent oxygenase [Xylaria telfairii]